MRQLSVRVSGEHRRARPQPGNAPRRGQPGEAQPSLRPCAFSVIGAPVRWPPTPSPQTPPPSHPDPQPPYSSQCDSRPVSHRANCFILHKPNSLLFRDFFCCFLFFLLVSNFLYLSPFFVSVINLSSRSFFCTKLCEIVCSYFFFLGKKMTK